MIDLTLSGYLDPKRSARLTLPATDEQIQYALDRMTEGIPIGAGFPYHITEVDCDLFRVDRHIRNNSELKEVNLLSYMLSNIQKDMRNLAVTVADKAADSLSSFINGIAAVKDGRYTEMEQPDGSGKWIEGRYIGNFNDTPDLYRNELLDSFLEKERGEYEQRQQAAAPVDTEHPFAHAKVKEPSKHELWGQIGATFFLTPDEAETLLALNDKTETLFACLVQERRYEVNDQFYAPASGPTSENIDMDNDIFIHLNAVSQQEDGYAGPSPDTLQKIWCRMGIVLYLDDGQLETLKQQDDSAANLVYDLINEKQYHTQGSCLFESGNEIEGYINPPNDFYIDYVEGNPPRLIQTHLDPEPDAENQWQEQGPTITM